MFFNLGQIYSGPLRNMDTGSSLDEENEFTNETFNATSSLKNLEFSWSRVGLISIFASLIIVTVVSS